MTIGETVFALVVVNSLGILVYILGVALLIARARYSDLERRYHESHRKKLWDEPLLHISKNSTPKSTEVTAMIMGFPRLPMSSIISRFAGLPINKEKNLKGDEWQQVKSGA